MLLLEHNDKAWNNDNEDEYDVADFYVGYDAIERLSYNIGEKLMLQYTFPIINQLIK